MQHNLSLRSGKSVDGRPGGSGDGHHEVRLVCRGPERRPKDARVGREWSWCGEVWQGTMAEDTHGTCRSKIKARSRAHWKINTKSVPAPTAFWANQTAGSG